MRKIWHDDAWEEYIEWQTKDKKTPLKKQLKKMTNVTVPNDVSH